MHSRKRRFHFTHSLQPNPNQQLPSAGPPTSLTYSLSFSLLVTITHHTPAGYTARGRPLLHYIETQIPAPIHCGLRWSCPVLSCTVTNSCGFDSDVSRKRVHQLAYCGGYRRANGVTDVSIRGKRDGRSVRWHTRYVHAVHAGFARARVCAHVAFVWEFVRSLFGFFVRSFVRSL